MKRSTLFLASLITVGSLAGCGKENSDSTRTENNTGVNSTRVTSIAVGSWESKVYRDEFGDPSENKYVIGEFEGTISGDQASSDEVTLKILFKSNGQSLIKIYRDDTPITGTSSGEEYEFRFKSEGSSRDVLRWDWSDTDIMTFGPSNTTRMKNYFNSNNSVELRVLNLDGDDPHYLFNLNCSNFREVLATL